MTGDWDTGGMTTRHDSPRDRAEHRCVFCGFLIATIAIVAAFILFLAGADWWAQQMVAVGLVFGAAALILWAMPCG